MIKFLLGVLVGYIIWACAPKPVETYWPKDVPEYCVDEGLGSPEYNPYYIIFGSGLIYVAYDSDESPIGGVTWVKYNHCTTLEGEEYHKGEGKWEYYGK